MKAGCAAMQLPAQGCQRLPAAARSWENSGRTPSWFQGSLTDTLASDSETSMNPGPGMINFCCSKPPSSWYFVAAAQGRESAGMILCFTCILS